MAKNMILEYTGILGDSYLFSEVGDLEGFCCENDNGPVSLSDAKDEVVAFLETTIDSMRTRINKLEEIKADVQYLTFKDFQKKHGGSNG